MTKNNRKYTQIAKELIKDYELDKRKNNFTLKILYSYIEAKLFKDFVKLKYELTPNEFAIVKERIRFLVYIHEKECL